MKMNLCNSLLHKFHGDNVILLGFKNKNFPKTIK